MLPEGVGAQAWIHSIQADIFFGMMIVVNAIALAIETELRTPANDQHYGWFIMDSTFNVIFLVEMLLRMYADKWNWFKDGWNLVDFLLVAAGVLDTWVFTFIGSIASLDGRVVTALRGLRLLRLLRLLRVFHLCKELMMIIAGVAAAMRAMVWGFILLFITIFLFSILITRLVGKSCCDPDDPFQDHFYVEYFGSIFRTGFTLLQFTMEFQPDICRRTWQDGIALTLFFIAYTSFTNVTLLNIISSIIVDAIMDISNGLDSSEVAEENADIENTLKVCFESADVNSDGVLTAEEVTGEVLSGDVQLLKSFEDAGIGMLGAQELCTLLDTRGSGRVSLDDFTETLMRIHKPPQAKHLLQIERRLVAIDVKVKDHMGEVMSLLNQLIDPTMHGIPLRREPGNESFALRPKEHMDEVLCYQEKPPQSSQEIDLKSRMDEMQSLLNNLEGLNNRGILALKYRTDEMLSLLNVLVEKGGRQQKPAQSPPQPNCDGVAQDITSQLLAVLQSELRAWRHDFQMQLEVSLSRAYEQCTLQQGTHQRLPQQSRNATHDIIVSWKKAQDTCAESF